MDAIWIVIREELSALVEAVDSMGNRMEGRFKQMDERFDKLEDDKPWKRDA